MKLAIPEITPTKRNSGSKLKIVYIKAICFPHEINSHQSKRNYRFLDDNDYKCNHNFRKYFIPAFLPSLYFFKIITKKILPGGIFAFPHFDTQ